MGVPLEVTAAAQRYKVLVQRLGHPPMVARLVFWPQPEKARKKTKRPRIITQGGAYVSVHAEDITILGPFDDDWSLPSKVQP